MKARPGQTLAVTVRRHGQLLLLNPTTVDLSKVDVKNFESQARPTAPTGFIGIEAAPAIVRTAPEPTPYVRVASSAASRSLG